MVDELVLTIFLMAPYWPAGNRGAFPRRAKNRLLSISVSHKNSRLFLKNSSRFFTEPEEPLWTAAENERTKTL